MRVGAHDGDELLDDVLDEVGPVGKRLKDLEDQVCL